MAVVYKGRDLLLQRYVAIKVMNESFSHDEEYIHRFNREAKNAASLSHANVVRVYDVGQEQDTHYLVMEFIDGPSLKELIQQRGKIPPEEAVGIALQICEGLAHAHEMQIVHRDIKPHNIMVTLDKQYKVTDFGIARASGETTITQTGSVMGSVHYFSPEQARGGEIGYSSDLYSLGVLLYEMVTGDVPFDGEAAVSIALKHLQEKPPDPRLHHPEIPDVLCNVIFKAMEKDPKDRYASAVEMIDDLRRVLYTLKGNDPLPEVEKSQDHEQSLSEESIEPPHGTVSYPGQQGTASQPQKRGSRSSVKKEPSFFRRLMIRVGISLSILVLVFVIALIGISLLNPSFANEDPDTPPQGGITNQPSSEEQDGIQQEQEEHEQQPSSPVSSLPREEEADPQPEEEEEVYPWWEEMPEYESNETLSNPRVTGKDGEYHVTLKANFDEEHGEESLYYNVVAVDSEGKRHSIVQRQTVPLEQRSQQHVSFVISVPKQKVPDIGGLYAEVYLTEYGKADTIRFPLETNGR